MPPGAAATDLELRRVTEGAPVSLAHCDRDGRYLFVNPAYSELLGRSPTEVMGKRLDEVLGAAAFEQLRRHVEDAIAGRRVEFERSVEFPTGTRIMHCTYIPDPGAPPVGFVAVLQDVTDRARADAALRESEQQVRRQLVELEALYSTAPLGLCMIDRDLRFRRINERMAEMNGVPVAAHLGKAVREVLPNLAEQAEEVLRHVLATGQPVRFELRGETPARPGVERVWDEHWYPLLAADGITEGVGVIAQEVTEQRQADAALRDREQRLRLALDFAEMGSWDWTIPTGEVVWSEKTRELFGVEAHVPITYELFESKLHPEDVERHRRAARESLQTGTYDDDFRIVLPNGAIRWLASRARLLRDAQGRPSRMLGVVTDVTERKRAEIALKEADRRKDEFLAMLAHELRNPLAPIRTGLQILRLSPPGRDAAHRAQEMMERQLTHMVRLIDDLLDVSRVSQGKVELKKERVSLRSVVESAVEAVQPQIEAGRHELVVQLPDVPLWLDADPTRVGQILGNLLHNAAKYTPSQGRITLSAERDGSFVAIRVTDTGVGIPRPMLSKVFELFTQVGHTPDRGQGGLGIGLSLAKKLVELHGGTIEADSPGLGAGSTFTVRLPLAAAPPLSPGPRTAGGEAQNRAMQVLVVDDNQDAAESLAMLLEIEGHGAITAFDGPTAIAKARQHRPDVVFLDIGLPGMSGYEAARQFRQDPELGQATLVALTGWGSNEDKRRALEAGFDFHLTKPVEADQVMSLLSQIRAR